MALPFQLKHQQNRSQTIISPVKVMLSKQSQKETAANPAWWFRKAEKRTLQNFQEMGLWECIVLMFLMETIESCACFHESIEGLLGSPCPHHSSQKNFHSMWFRTTSFNMVHPQRWTASSPEKLPGPQKERACCLPTIHFCGASCYFFFFGGVLWSMILPSQYLLRKQLVPNQGQKCHFAVSTIANGFGIPVITSYNV